MVEDQVQERIAGIVGSNDVVLFMKGTPIFPQCGFSSTAVQILEHLGVGFEGVDVLRDPEVRAGVKEYSDWRPCPSSTSRANSSAARTS